MIEALQDIYNLVAATDGVTALERAVSDPRPDLILLDVMMPDMDGHEVCRQLKGNPETFDIPVIFVTALSKPDDEAHGLGLGAVDYITKPISPPVVEARVRAHLQLTQAKKVLEEQNVVLEKRVEKKTEDVIRAQKERVEGLNNFANAVAHQIRNPVTSIGGMAGLLVKKTPADSPLIGYAEAVRENTVRLEELVGAISDYVSLTAGEVEPVSVETILSRAVDDVRGHADEAGVEFQCEMRLAEGVILVDAGLVHHALVEILRNTVDFSEGGRASVVIEGGTHICDDALSAAEQFYSTDCRYGVRITDNGPGIMPADMAYVMDPFFTTKAFGAGLGLTRAKRILCDELGGAMRVRNVPGAGVAVTMTFAGA